MEVALAWRGYSSSPGEKFTCCDMCREKRKLSQKNCVFSYDRNQMLGLLDYGKNNNHDYFGQY